MFTFGRLPGNKWLRSGECRIIERKGPFATGRITPSERPVRRPGPAHAVPSAGRPLDRPAPRMSSGHYHCVVPECLFCGIAAGRIPATIVLDGKRIIAFRDINPQAPTHVLVVPREHFPDAAALAAAGGGLL